MWYVVVCAALYTICVTFINKSIIKCCPCYAPVATFIKYIYIYIYCFNMFKYVDRGTTSRLNCKCMLTNYAYMTGTRGLICSCYGSKLRCTRFKSLLGRMFAIEVVHIRCSKLFKGTECAVRSMILCTI